MSLPDRSGDIIFIYFTGHGSQDGIEGPWPVLRIPKGTYLRSAEILYFLRQHKHRLAVAVINACNVQPSVTDTHEILTHGHQNIFHNASLPGFKSLFLGTRGIVFISASSPGGVSYSFDCSESVIVDGLFKTFDKFGA